MIDEKARQGIIRMHQEGYSSADISQKLNIKKHTVLGVIKEFDTLANTPSNTLANPPETPFAIPLQTPYGHPQYQPPQTAKEREIALQIQLLQEQNRAKELEVKLAEVKSKEVAEKEQTEREKNKNLSGVELKKLELQNKAIEQNEKNQKLQAAALKLERQKLADQQAQRQAAARAAEVARQKAIDSLETEITEFLEDFENYEVGKDYPCSQEQADEYHEQAQELMAKIAALFEDEDYEEFVHYETLDYLANLFDADFSEGGFFKTNYANFEWEEEGETLIQHCNENQLGEVVLDEDEDYDQEDEDEQDED